MDINRHSIRPSSSSSIRAPSWSLGLGADSKDDHFCCNKTADYEEEEDDDIRSDEEELERQLGGRLSLSSSVPANPSAISRRRNRCHCHQPELLSNPVANDAPLNPKINVEIPTVFLSEVRDLKSNSTFHVYQLNLTRNNETERKWSVYRRYSQFLALHQALCSIEPTIKTFSFPPKRRLNSKASTIVQDRRQRLEEYMRLLCDFMASQPRTSGSPSGEQQSEHDTVPLGSRKNKSVRSLFDEFISPRADGSDDREELYALST